MPFKDKEQALANKKAYYEANRTAIKAKQKAYREAHKKKRQEAKKAWQEANAQRIKARRRERYEAEKEVHLAKNKAWRKANAEKIRLAKQAKYKEESKKLRRRSRTEYGYDPLIISYVKAHLKEGVPDNWLARTFKMHRNTVRLIGKGLAHAKIKPHPNPPPISPLRSLTDEEKLARMRLRNGRLQAALDSLKPDLDASFKELDLS
jgi:hypothetical protein